MLKVRFCLDTKDIIDYNVDENLLYFNDEVLNLKVDNDVSYPHHVDIRINLGYRCNYRCKYCLQTQNHDQQEPYIDPEPLTQYIIKFLKHKKIGMLSCWGGEPFLYLDYLRTIYKNLDPYLDKVDNNLVYSYLITNGSLLYKQEVRDFFEAYPKIAMTLSYDGPGHFLRHQNDLLDNPIIYDYVQHLIKTERFSISSVLNKYNPSVIKCYTYIYNKLKSTDYQISPTIMQISNDEAVKYAMSEQQLREYLQEFYTFHDFLYRCSPWLNRDALDFIHNLGYTDQSNHCFVTAGNTLSLDMYGNILICQNNALYQLDDQIAQENEYVLGHLKDQEPGSDLIIPRALKSKQRWKTICQACYVKHFCSGGCVVGDEKYQQINCNHYKYKYLAKLLFFIRFIANNLFSTSKFEITSMNFLK
jgi:radical SAM protein with 4Fe4S-binding SPASM domain